MLDTENAHICVTGSSSRLLSREIASSLRGRTLATEILPFSFGEFLRHRGETAPVALARTSAPDRSRFEARYREYLTVGGFPEVQGLEAALRIRVLQDYLSVALFRDVAERHAVRNLPALRAFIRQLLASNARPFSVHKCHRDLRSQGLSVGKDSLYAFLGYVEDAFLVFPVSRVASWRKRTVTPCSAWSGMISFPIRSEQSRSSSSTSNRAPRETSGVYSNS